MKQIASNFSSSLAHAAAAALSPAQGDRGFLSDGFFDPLTLQPCFLQLPLAIATLQHLDDPGQFHQPASGQREHLIRILAQTPPTAAHMRDQGSDQGHMEPETQATLAVADQMLKVSVELQPAKEQLDLPAMTIQRADDIRWHIQQDGDQPYRLAVLGVINHHFPQPLSRSASAREVSDPIRDHSMLNILWAKSQGASSDKAGGVGFGPQQQIPYLQHSVHQYK